MAGGRGTEAPAAGGGAEGPADTAWLMEEVCQAANVRKAYRAVRSNRGSPGVDGMTVEALLGHLRVHWREIRERLLAGTYRPQAVRRVEIPKPGGGVRKLGIPTVLDRFIQQALLQVLQRQWDRTFSEHSYGFRPGRSAHQAVARAQEYVRGGCRWVVDMDLEKFFDRVNHDVLMSRVAKRVRDKRVLCLLRAYLEAGVLEDGLVRPTTEGTPQGGPLSPLLSNLLLDDLDRELERRGLSFVRYADDCNIYVRSRRAGDRVMASIRRYLERKLRLRVNESKSAVARPWERKFLGFSFTRHFEPKRRLAPQTLERFRGRVRHLTGRNRGVSLVQRLKALTSYLLGWRGYFGYCETPAVLGGLDKWVRRRLRSVLWKQWRHARRRYQELRKRDVNRNLAARTVRSRHGPWRLSESPALHYALPDTYFAGLGLPTLTAGVTA